MQVATFPYEIGRVRFGNAPFDLNYWNEDAAIRQAGNIFRLRRAESRRASTSGWGNIKKLENSPSLESFLMKTAPAYQGCLGKYQKT